MTQQEPGIIDCHFHPSVDGETDTNWFYPSGDIQVQVDTLRRAGISKACGAPVISAKSCSFDQVKRLNDNALALRDRLPEFYIPGIQVHPHFPEESCGEIQRCCGREGVRWIGELAGYMMGYGEEYASERALVIMQAAEVCGAVVNFHCADLDVVEQLCRAIPTLKLVLAHHGASSGETRRRLELVATYANLHLDISGSAISRYGIIRKSVEVAGREKILFGTDFPINNPAICVEGVRSESLSDQDRDAILRDNFLRLIQESEA